MPRHEIDLSELPGGATYSDEYGAWLGIFKLVAESEEAVLVRCAPRVWTPLLLYLGADVVTERVEFAACTWVNTSAFKHARDQGKVREYVESVCASRPELVDALWKSDMEWETDLRFTRHQKQHEFVVGSQSAFYRPEVRAFERDLAQYQRPAHVRNCVITNCTADKPYPALLHSRIKARLPDESWHMLIATSLSGIVPEEMWSRMPLYDAGLPHLWRVMVGAADFFGGRDAYDRIVVYTEFHTRPLAAAFNVLGLIDSVEWVCPIDEYKSYLPLQDVAWLRKLEGVLG